MLSMLSKEVKVRIYDIVLITVFIAVISIAFTLACVENNKLTKENARLRVDSQETEILLKDCPICGSKVEVSRMYAYNAYTIKCTKCGLSSKVYCDLDKLIDYWNTGTR